MKKLYIEGDQRDGITYAIAAAMFINCGVLMVLWGGDHNGFIPTINILWWNLLIISIAVFRVLTTSDSSYSESERKITKLRIESPFGYRPLDPDPDLRECDSNANGNGERYNRNDGRR